MKKGFGTLEVIVGLVILLMIAVSLLFAFGRSFSSLNKDLENRIGETPLDYYDGCIKQVKFMPIEARKKVVDRDNDGVPDHCDRCLGGKDNLKELNAGSKGGLKHGYDDDRIPDTCDKNPNKKNKVLGEDVEDLQSYCENFVIVSQVDGKIEDFYCCKDMKGKKFTTAHGGCVSR